MEVDQAYRLICRAIDDGRAAGGYLVSGDVKGNCEELVTLVLSKLFPEELPQIEAGVHPDVVRLEPSGKSRTIKVERTDSDPSPGMRDAIIEPMSATSFSGGWKVGVISFADRMQIAAANAFLKSLEEPTPKTMYLLLTDQPDAIIPTIVSRCQRIDLRLPAGVLEGEERRRVAEAFAAKDAMALADVLRDLKDESEDPSVVRRAFYRTIMAFARKMMVEGMLPRHLAFRNVEAVEAAYRRSEKSINDDAVISCMIDSFSFP